MRVWFIPVVAVAVLASMHLAGAQAVQHPDKKLDSKKVTGRLVGYQHGDYGHASVRTERGSEQSFFIDDEVCFLALNREEVLTIEYDEVQRFFPEGGGYSPANIIQSIAAGAGQRRWFRSKSAKPTAAELQECHRVLRTHFIPRSAE
jgi:hypothetical protein